ncbi:MAG: ADP-forming succinate--CoA ligase subunit beta [Candidatus Tectomicrobia bacterium]|nr:ADP-forming succinate--CoA ligase subunit beta [Candidatus Tectomicrobia bacterium]
MKIHEYQAKEILSRYGVPVPRGKVAAGVDEAEAIARELGGACVVKAQIHAGGRGKGGGVKLVKSPQEARGAAQAILGMQLVTPQTGPAGQKVKRVLVEQGMAIARELYLGMLVDRARNALVVMASEAGGMEIEEVAAATPEKILKEYVDPAVGLRPFQTMRLAYGLHLPAESVRKASSFMLQLYRAFVDMDLSLAEINPLVLTKDGNLLALDAKVNFDDNALFRHPETKELRDLDEEDPREIEASKYGLSYIKLDGTVGCMVNGAGLAMATMDIIKHFGAEPANFLDVGGGASSETVANAFRIIISDERVKAVLINIFGGIVRCDRVAQGIIEALQKVQVEVPVVVRLEGTNATEAAKLLQESPLNFRVATGLSDAAQKVVAASA